MLDELSGKLTYLVHFFGRIPHNQLIALFQVSTVHVYLSYPFVLGWSLLEAMSCGCAIVGSKGMPVSEVITDGVDGILVSMDNVEELIHKVSFLIDNPSMRASLSFAARKRAFDFEQSKTLPALSNLVLNTCK